MRFSVLLAAASLTAAASPALAAGPSGPMPDPATAVREMDANKDGGVSKQEWVDTDHRAEAFDAIDSNKDGKLTVAEITAARARMTPTRTREAPTPLPRVADPNAAS
jgi:hypothetical protein